ncbi:class I SAM-dependent methyltransferase [Patescibacteria group bacterium]
MSILFSSNSEQKDYVYRRMVKYYPNFISGGKIYLNTLNKIIANNSIVLDVGCGTGGLIEKIKEKPKEIIGLDIDHQALSKNNFITKKILSSAESVPLPEKSIDVVTAEFVIEHLENPNKVFKEIYRLLKTNGSFVFITPNIKNPLMLLSKYTPPWLHQAYRQGLLKKSDQIYRTYYRVNTYKQLGDLAYQAGFTTSRLALAGNPEYLSIAKPLVTPVIIFEREIFGKRLINSRMYLIGRFIK